MTIQCRKTMSPHITCFDEGKDALTAHGDTISVGETFGNDWEELEVVQVGTDNGNTVAWVRDLQGREEKISAEALLEKGRVN